MSQENQENEPIESYMELQVAGKPRKVKVSSFKIDWEGKQEEVIVKRLSYGERADFTDKFIKVEVQGDISRTVIDMHSMQIQTLLMTIIKAPFPVTEDYITNELDGVIGETIYKIADNLNKIDADKKKNSNMQSSTVVMTQK